MHWLDSTILAVLAAAAILGAYSGLFMQVFRLVGFGVSLFAANNLYGGVADWLRETLMRTAEPRSISLVAFSVVFLGIYLAFFLFTVLVERGLQHTQLQFVNRCLGAGLAVAKMGLLMGTVCYGLQQLPFQPATQLLEESTMAPILARSVEQAMAAVPAEYKLEWRANWNHMLESLPASQTASKLDLPAPEPTAPR